jgi:peptidoglycan/LPS O-acetylase OafA/YrhL
MRHHNFRYDIQGLRAIAVLFVFVNHFFPHVFATGFIGVDIFFVISGYVIISTVLNEVEHTGHFSIRKFYSRRIRRILPAATLVLATASVMVYFLFPVSERGLFGSDILAAALWFVNFAFAARSVDYLNSDTGQSIVQHFWSLSVEEQFYFVTPILLIILYMVFKGTRKSLSQKKFNQFLTMYGFLVAVIIIASFFCAIIFTYTNPVESYFLSPSRFWEIAIGCFVAVLQYMFAFTNMNRIASNTLSVIGLACIVASAVVATPPIVWPSSITLLPVLGTALLISSGCSTKSTPVLKRVLGVKPLVKIGDLSFELYLWHWVLLMSLQHFWAETTGLDLEKTFRCIVLSVVLASLTKALVSDPVRQSRTIMRKKRLTFSIGVVLVAVSSFSGFFLVHNYNSLANSFTNSADAAQMAEGELTLDGFKNSYSSITPNPLTADKDLPASYAEECESDQSVDDEVKICQRGDLESDKQIFAVGDSMMQQWEAVLDRFGKENGYNVQLIIKSNCVWMNAVTPDKKQPDGRYESCYRWSNKVVDYALDQKPELLISSQHAFEAYKEDGNSASIQNARIGLQDFWGRLVDGGIKVGVVLKNPVIENINMKNIAGDDSKKVSRAYDCAVDHANDLSKCLFTPDRRVSEAQLEAVQTFDKASVGVIDMNPFICLSDGGSDNKGVCPTVIGTGDQGVLVYRQGSHLTNTFVETLYEHFRTGLTRILGIDTAVDTDSAKANDSANEGDSPEEDAAGDAHKDATGESNRPSNNPEHPVTTLPGEVEVQEL